MTSEARHTELTGVVPPPHVERSVPKKELKQKRRKYAHCMHEVRTQGSRLRETHPQ